MGLGGFAPKSDTAVLLLSGDVVEIHIRPFILADKAWWEQSFTPEELQGLENLEVEPMCKAIWQQLDVESKKLFGKIEFKDVDDNGEEFTTKVAGYQKIMHSIKKLEDVISLYGKVLQVVRDNDFLPSDSKKKTVKAA